MGVEVGEDERESRRKKGSRRRWLGTGDAEGSQRRRGNRLSPLEEEVVVVGKVSEKVPGGKSEDCGTKERKESEVRW